MNQNEEDRYLVRFSGEWFAYMFPGLGIFRVLVTTIMDFLAICAPLFLLTYLGYGGVKTAVWFSHPGETFPDILEIVMFILQIGGLEGSIPGLARKAKRMRQEDLEKQAERVDRVISSAQWMTVLSIGEGALHVFAIIPANLFQGISAVLLVARSVVIISFLKEMAVTELAAPRVLSRKKHQERLATRTGEDNRQQELARLHAEHTALQTTHSQMLADVEKRLLEARESFQREVANVKTHMAQEFEEAKAHLISAHREEKASMQHIHSQEMAQARAKQQAEKSAPKREPKPAESIQDTDEELFPNIYERGRNFYQNPLGDGRDFWLKSAAGQEWGVSEKRIDTLLLNRPQLKIRVVEQRRILVDTRARGYLIKKAS